MTIMKMLNRKSISLDLTLDYHAHILPKCDHGSDSVEISCKQLEMAASSGISTICATPHFYPHKDTVSSFLQRRRNSYESLSPFLTNDAPRILLGAEILICDGMENMDNLNSLCLQGTNEILLEMPFYPWLQSIWETVFRLKERTDIRIVIAHADRYPEKNIKILAEAGMVLQLNVDSLLKPIHRKTYLSWIQEGYVKYLGSDIHGTATGYRSWTKSVRMLNKRFELGKKGEF